jgi:3-methylcrotonyl-CoA carboxylase alpha subunit
VASLARREARPEAISPWMPGRGATGFRLGAPPSRAAHVYIDGAPARASVDFGADPGDLVVDGDAVIVFANGAASRLSLTRPADGAAAGGLSDGAVRTPMPGRIVSIAVEAGQAVAAGQTLVVLEAMKMEHALTAPADGRVAEVRVALGEQVAEGVVAVRLDLAS